MCESFWSLLVFYDWLCLSVLVCLSSTGCCKTSVKLWKPIDCELYYFSLIISIREHFMKHSPTVAYLRYSNSLELYHRLRL